MHSLQKLLSISTALAIGWSAATSADHHGGDGVTAVPVELFACTWREGKGMEDLLAVTERFNKWSAAADASYSAWIITPRFRSEEDGFEVGWIGSWDSGADMGTGMDAWLSEGGELGGMFDAVVDCGDFHALMASYPVVAPEGPPADGIVWFSSCTLAEDRSLKQAYAAHKQASTKMRAMGSKASSWMFVPALGAGDIKFDYYSVVTHNNYADLGTNFDRYFNGGGLQHAGAALRGVVSCNSPRLYDARQVTVGSPD